MSNAQRREQVLDAYFVSNLHLAYSFRLPAVKEVKVGFSIYNIFNETYENNGYAASEYKVKDGEKHFYYYSGYAAQAGTNVMGTVTVKF